MGDAGTSILDLLREATAVQSHAIASLDDPFAVAAFCSDGREEVQHVLIKDFGAPFDRTASLIAGVAASGTGQPEILLAGTAGLVAGTMSMAAGEYVSVSSQTDSETADLARERAELATDPVGELRELTEIHVRRGLDRDLAVQVARQLTERDALGAHARDELGLTETAQARPLQAALSSAAAFATGAALPLATVLVAPPGWIGMAATMVSLAALALLGAVSARTGGSPMMKAAIRVTFWGAAAMAATAGVGALFGVALA